MLRRWPNFCILNDFYLNRSYVIALSGNLNICFRCLLWNRLYYLECHKVFYGVKSKWMNTILTKYINEAVKFTIYIRMPHTFFVILTCNLVYLWDNSQYYHWILIYQLSNQSEKQYFYNTNHMHQKWLVKLSIWTLGCPKSARNRCVIEVWRLCVVTLLFGFFLPV